MRVSVVCDTRLSALSLFFYTQQFYSIQLYKYVSCTLEILRGSFVLSGSVVDELVRRHCAT